MPNLIGQSLGRYHILEQLGEGGMATVYKAYDTRLETDVAVKVIRTENLPQSGVEKALKRFEREAKALAKLTHPNIVPIIDYGEQEGSPYLVMKYLPGGTLKQVLKGQPMSWEKAAILLIPIARALDYAHRQGMIHRDVKPSNILITADGEPMLTDFGIAKIVDEANTVDLTGTNVTIGTPEYMAPEQVVSKTVDLRADIYALGVILYEMVTGRRPFQADTPFAVLLKHASEPLPRPRQFVPDLPEEVEKVLFKALAKQPEDRYQSMGEFAAALERLVYEKKVLPLVENQSLPQDARVEAEKEERKAPEPERATQQSLGPTVLAQPEEKTSAPAAKRNFSRAWLLVGVILVLALIGWFTWRLAGLAPLGNVPAQVTNSPVSVTQVANSSVPEVLPTLVPASPTPEPTVPPDMLMATGQLQSGQELLSLNKRYSLKLLSDGDLVLYDNGTGTTIWSANTTGRQADHLSMQDDGNLVLYTKAGTPVWASNSNSTHGDYFLQLQDGGNLVIYRGKPNVGNVDPIWSTGT